MKKTIFIPSGAGAPGFAGICKELQLHGGFRVVAGDMRAGVYGATLADEFVVMPHACSWVEAEALEIKIVVKVDPVAQVEELCSFKRTEQ